MSECEQPLLRRVETTLAGASDFPAIPDHYVCTACNAAMVLSLDQPRKCLRCSSDYVRKMRENEHPGFLYHKVVGDSEVAALAVSAACPQGHHEKKDPCRSLGARVDAPGAGSSARKVATINHSGLNFCRELVKVLGLEGKPIQKIVIEADVRSIPTVYVKGIVTKEQCAGILDVLHVVQVKDVCVKDDGTVVVDDPVVIRGGG